MRREFMIAVALLLFLSVVVGFLAPRLLWGWVVLGPIVGLGLYDYFQEKRSIPRNFPVLGHLRYLFEFIRPEIYQYFIESDTSGSLRSRPTLFGLSTSQGGSRYHPVRNEERPLSTGYEWVNHSMIPVHHEVADMRVSIGGPQCAQPYSAEPSQYFSHELWIVEPERYLGLEQRGSHRQVRAQQRGRWY